MKKKNNLLLGFLIVLLIIISIVSYVLYIKHPLCNVSSEKNIIIPSSKFEDNNNTIKCKNKVYNLRKSKSNDDPGHTIYNVDPPNNNSYDCDGKADDGIKNIAMNCLPVRDESQSHN